VRHKLADMVGDLALAGCDLIGRFTAFRSGHRLNAELVRAIVAQGQVQDERRRCA
jgi:UDP-3-O-[3-hydroxymyristoyl] N-acetylglucosamine deacetylase